MGILIGIFHQSDDYVTIWEGLLATVVFVGVSMVAMIHAESKTAGTFLVLIMGWIAVWIGLFTGNAVRHDLRNHFIKHWYESLAKRELQVLIAEFLRLSSRLVYFNSLEDQERLANVMTGIDQQLDHILSKFSGLKDVTGKFSRIQEICHLYYEFSQNIIATGYSEEIIAEWTKLGDHLELISHQSLYYTENKIKRSISVRNIVLRALAVMKGAIINHKLDEFMRNRLFF